MADLFLALLSEIAQCGSSTGGGGGGHLPQMPHPGSAIGIVKDQ